MRNLWIISAEYPGESDWGGIARIARNLAEGLPEEGFAVRVCSLTFASNRTEQKEGSHWVVRIPFITRKIKFFRRLFHGAVVNRYFETWHWFWVMLERSLLVWWEVWRVPAKQRPDFILCFDCYAECFFLGLIRPRAVHQIVNLQMGLSYVWELNEVNFTWAHRAIAMLEHAAVRMADLVIAPSEQMASECRKKMALKKRPIVVIPNPFDKDTSSSRCGPIQRDAATILYAGRIEARKGVLELGEAIPLILEAFPHAQFVFYGDDAWFHGRPLLAQILARIPKKWHGQVRFPGHLTRADLFVEFQRCTLAVFPSRFESFGYTCLEAMACGTPVVGSKFGGMADMIEHGKSGYVVDIFQKELLAQLVISLLGDTNLRERIGKAAIERVKTRFSSQRVIKELADCLHRLCTAD